MNTFWSSDKTKEMKMKLSKQTCKHAYLSLVTRNPICGVYDRVGLNPASTATEARYRLEVSYIETRRIVLSRQPKQKRWSDCADVQADLRLCCSHMTKTAFLMTWLILKPVVREKQGSLVLHVLNICAVDFSILINRTCPFPNLGVPCVLFHFEVSKKTRSQRLRIFFFFAYRIRKSKVFSWDRNSNLTHIISPMGRINQMTIGPVSLAWMLRIC